MKTEASEASLEGVITSSAAIGIMPTISVAENKVKVSFRARFGRIHALMDTIESCLPDRLDVVLVMRCRQDDIHSLRAWRMVSSALGVEYEEIMSPPEGRALRATFEEAGRLFQFWRELEKGDLRGTTRFELEISPK